MKGNKVKKTPQSWIQRVGWTWFPGKFSFQNQLKSTGWPWGQDPGTPDGGVDFLLFFSRWKGPPRLRGRCQSPRVGARWRKSSLENPWDHFLDQGRELLHWPGGPGSSPRMMPTRPLISISHIKMVPTLQGPTQLQAPPGAPGQCAPLKPCSVFSFLFLLYMFGGGKSVT